jgi:hypothetical protein
VTCAGTNRRGEPCRSREIPPDSEWCKWHGPHGRIAQHAEWESERQIFEQLRELEVTQAQRDRLDWLIFRTRPNSAQMAYLTARVCGVPVASTAEMTRDQAADLIARLEYWSQSA